MRSILCGNVTIFCSQFKCNYLKSEKNLLYFLFHFWNIHQNLNILKEKIIVIANVFPKSQTLKDLVRPLSKKWRVRIPFDSRHVKESQKFAWENFSHNFESLWGKPIWKMSLLVICEILGAFVNTLTNEDKYPLKKCGNLWLTIQMQLPKKRKTCSDFFGPFWNLYQILIILKKKDGLDNIIFRI